jgi:peptidoglycan-N-acetylglucosamine deacetylase
MSSVRPICSVSLDLDNLWAYQMTHGNPGWEAMASYYDVVVPRILRLVERLGAPITVFVVGADAARPEHHEFLRALVDVDCELGNHSYRHQPWLHRYSASDVASEIKNAADAIEHASGVRPTGFRGPGYSLTPAVLDALIAQGYLYDASTLPTVIGPIARAIYFRSATLTDEQRAERSELFGHVRDGVQPLRPYRFHTEAGSLIELPVTTLPLARVPLHLSYVLALAGLSTALARQYFARALDLCRVRNVELSLLLHPLDLLHASDARGLEFFPGAQMPLSRKLGVLDACLEVLASQFEVLTTVGHASRYADAALPTRQASSIGSFRLRLGDPAPAVSQAQQTEWIRA